MLRIVASEEAEQDGLQLDLDALVREGARRMLLAPHKIKGSTNSRPNPTRGVPAALRTLP